MLIQILGPGCKNCKALLQNVEVALKRQHIEAHVEYITDVEMIGNSGIMRTPGLVIDHQVISQGKVLAPIEIEAILKSRLSL